MIVDPIPLHGPSITHHEIEHIASAGAEGWNGKSRTYLQAFQALASKTFKRKYTAALSSCTGATHIALIALGLKKGDEVIVPELTDIGIATCVLYTGAIPVFCDVDPLTLCIDPKEVERHITPRTKGIVAAHLYGQPCDMTPLEEIALRNNLFLLEDTTQGVGSSYNGLPAGCFGQISVCSFNAEQVIVSGEGGMLMTSDPQIFSKAAKLMNRGRSASSPFVYDAVGFNYGISSMQAAMGFAQLTRLGKIIEKKRTIHDWYKKELANISGIHMNTEHQKDTEPSFLTNVLFLEDENIKRSAFIRFLRTNNIMAEPIYFPLSSMPLFQRANNRVAYTTAAKALLLPSGVNRTQEEIEYVCDIIKRAQKKLSSITSTSNTTTASLKTKPASFHEKETISASANIQRSSAKEAAAKQATSAYTATDLRVLDVELHGWLKDKSDILELFFTMKKEGFSLPFTHNDKRYTLKAITAEDIKNPQCIKTLAQWKEASMPALLNHVTVTEQYMQKVMEQYIQKIRDFILFLITDDNNLYGEVGLDDFDFQQHGCMMDYLYMEDTAPRGLAAAACEALFTWARDVLKIKHIYNHVIASNKKVRVLIAAQGFKELSRTSLYKEETPGGNIYRPMLLPGHSEPDEHLIICVKHLE